MYGGSQDGLQIYCNTYYNDTLLALFGGPAHPKNEYLNEYGARCGEWNRVQKKEILIIITSDNST